MEKEVIEAKKTETFPHTSIAAAVAKVRQAGK